ncbi:MAG TPA: LysM peptidoglycan-binding domain-containing protein [Anaerolineales bacterium]|nr:LysM peptidoglycan-binding domain-containing protein [Anaerolineales bacterium]
MKICLRCLTICLFFLVWLLPATHALAGPPNLPPLQEEETATEEASTESPEETTPTPSMIYPVDIINAVNDLRIQNGLPVLAVHQALMDIAAQTANALAATEGGAGHYRPCNLTLGQMLLMRGFALWGDLSQDGYRSENWVTADTVEQAISFWSSDELHLDTMLDSNRSHIGAAIAVGDQVYMVIVTALQVPSGKMQWGADKYLTQAAVTQAACAGWSTQRAGSGNPGDLSQYSVPVVRSTARPDGDVIHEVKYGQTLWSIAIDYGTTIEQIKRLNNLTSDTVVPGWTLLVKKGATQPVPSPTPFSTFDLVKQNLTTSTPELTFTPALTEKAPALEAGEFVRQNSMVVVAFVISFSVLVAAIVGFRKKKEE